jgi:hypothetical protein
MLPLCHQILSWKKMRNEMLEISSTKCQTIVSCIARDETATFILCSHNVCSSSVAGPLAGSLDALQTIALFVVRIQPIQFCRGCRPPVLIGHCNLAWASNLVQRQALLPYYVYIESPVRLDLRSSNHQLSSQFLNRWLDAAITRLSVFHQPQVHVLYFRECTDRFRTLYQMRGRNRTIGLGNQ